jgi:hypothetical protein
MKKLVFIIALLFLQSAFAKGVHHPPLAFVNQAFQGDTPTVSTLWLTKEKKRVISDILQHSPGFIRVKYWQQGAKTAWILNEVGKEKPITVGVVIESGQIKQLKVLTFRESRGWEVKHDFFTRQFNNIAINKELRLNQSIDGISGATLSVRALKKIARIALYLEQHINK